MDFIKLNGKQLIGVNGNSIGKFTEELWSSDITKAITNPDKTTFWSNDNQWTQNLPYNFKVTPKLNDETLSLTRNWEPILPVSEEGTLAYKIANNDLDTGNTKISDSITETSKKYALESYPFSNWNTFTDSNFAFYMEDMPQYTYDNTIINKDLNILYTQGNSVTYKDGENIDMLHWLNVDGVYKKNTYMKDVFNLNTITWKEKTFGKPELTYNPVHYSSKYNANKVVHGTDRYETGTMLRCDFSNYVGKTVTFKLKLKPVKDLSPSIIYDTDFAIELIPSTPTVDEIERDNYTRVPAFEGQGSVTTDRIVEVSCQVTSDNKVWVLYAHPYSFSIYYYYETGSLYHKDGEEFEIESITISS